MAMKKADMEAHYAGYHDALKKAKAAERKGMYRAAMGAALSAWEYLDGMIQYARKYQNQESTHISAIDLVLYYAPLLLDMRSLDKLEQLLEETRRIVRNMLDDLTAKILTSRSLVWDNQRLWSHLDNFPESPQDELATVLGGQQDYWRSVIEAWVKMGLVTRVGDAKSYRVALVVPA
jgi:hypothetical protein